MRRYLFQVLFVAAGFCSGCHPKGAPSLATAPVPHEDRDYSGLGAGHDYVDLQPGWTVRVVIPLSKHGVLGHLNYEATSAGQPDSSLTVKAPKNFGFETDTYVVSARPDVILGFQKAEVTRKGESTPQPKAIVPLFDLPGNTAYARLFFLARVSRTDHNMAILAAANQSRLEEFTRTLQSDLSACRNSIDTFCSWVPVGIAVTPAAQ